MRKQLSRNLNLNNALICFFGTVVLVVAAELYRRYKRKSTYANSDLAFRPTANRQGFSLPPFTWVSETYLNDIRKKNSPEVLVVAAGWGFMALKALEANALSRVTANDLSQEHLDYLKSQVKASELSRLTLLPGNIFEKELPAQRYDAVLLRNVLHFFSGDQVESLLEKINACLKPGGKVYIVTGSPYIKLLHNTKILEEMEQRKNSGDAWPGFLPNFRRMLAQTAPDLAAKLPEQMHLMHVGSLETALEKKGFEIEHIDYHPAPEFTGPAAGPGRLITFDGHEYVAAIAEKPQQHSASLS